MNDISRTGEKEADVVKIVIFCNGNVNTVSFTIIGIANYLIGPSDFQIGYDQVKMLRQKSLVRKWKN